MNFCNLSSVTLSSYSQLFWPKHYCLFRVNFFDHLKIYYRHIIKQIFCIDNERRTNLALTFFTILDFFNWLNSFTEFPLNCMHASEAYWVQMVNIWKHLLLWNSEFECLLPYNFWWVLHKTVLKEAKDLCSHYTILLPYWTITCTMRMRNP